MAVKLIEKTFSTDRLNHTTRRWKTEQIQKSIMNFGQKIVSAHR
jgi:hypothetical protein